MSDSPITADQVREIVRDAINDAVRDALKKAFKTVAGLSDRRRTSLTTAEVTARYGVGVDALTSLVENKRIRGRLVPGKGRGGKVWKYDLSDCERVLAVVPNGDA
jgi:hypothetical protein